MCVLVGNIPSAPVTSLNSPHWLQGRLAVLTEHDSTLMRLPYKWEVMEEQWGVPDYFHRI